jgi:proline dehydrogenase
VKKRLRRIAGALLRLAVRMVGRIFVRGRALGDATRACRKHALAGRSSTIGYFNEDNEPPASVARSYMATIDAITREQLDFYLSVKIPALDFDPALLQMVVDHGQSGGIGIHFDSHQHDLADRTFEAVKQAHQRFPRIGCTLPGRWPRSLQDAELAIALGLRVRVVKGQWADPTAPDIDRREGFLAVIDRLAGRAKHVAVATHDPPLAREALRRLRAAGTPCDMELLVALPMRSSLRTAKEIGAIVRVYVPFGASWISYALTQAQRNPRIAWWVVRDALFGGLPDRTERLGPAPPRA